MAKTRKVKPTLESRLTTVFTIISIVLVTWFIVSFIQVNRWNLIDPSRISEWNMFKLYVRWSASL
jgi:uncharacterized membrane protein